MFTGGLPLAVASVIIALPPSDEGFTGKRYIEGRSHGEDGREARTVSRPYLRDLEFVVFMVDKRADSMGGTDDLRRALEDDEQRDLLPPLEAERKGLDEKGEEVEHPSMEYLVPSWVVD